MPDDAGGLLNALRGRLIPDPHENKLVTVITRREVPLKVVGYLAAEERHIVASDWSSFLALASRAGPGPARDFFAFLALGEGLVYPMLPALAAACGLDVGALDAYEPEPGCQAYPAYLAWLAVHGEPADVVAALTVNFAAWGGYCAAIAQALRRDHGLDDRACEFLDFFAAPSSELDRLARRAVQAALDSGQQLSLCGRYGRLLHSYEIMFWDTLADLEQKDRA